MNEIDLLLVETVEACRQRRQMLRVSIRSAKRGKINLARPLAKVFAAAGRSGSQTGAGA